jgi:hypothetical protein
MPHMKSLKGQSIKGDAKTVDEASLAEIFACASLSGNANQGEIEFLSRGSHRISL